MRCARYIEARRPVKQSWKQRMKKNTKLPNWLFYGVKLPIQAIWYSNWVNVVNMCISLSLSLSCSHIHAIGWCSWTLPYTDDTERKRYETGWSSLLAEHGVLSFVRSMAVIVSLSIPRFYGMVENHQRKITNGVRWYKRDKKRNEHWTDETRRKKKECKRHELKR